ncbi:MAG: TonB-dependent receptor [Dysgonamonadaceae bacterium]|jgi:TonB-linked SusC/RagA family outer membrane protein|nr:TonB-dependent receptor [Dysgonamonadaceae bacterium]
MKKFTINLSGKSVLLAFLMFCGGSYYNGFVYADEKGETSIFQGNLKVTGVLKDTGGEPVMGVSVTVVGTGLGTTSDLDGKFQVTVPNTQSKLEFRYLGFATKVITVGNQTTFEITMEEDSKLLDEVVVIGYGSLKRSDLTGAVSSVSMPTLLLSSQTNAFGGMTGTVSGVNIIRNNNKPGGTYDIVVRGLSSISGTNAPLVVIDGIPVPAQGSGQTGFTTGLESINPDDIEKIDILKDASSTAIYGSRASNGVIIVTTKRGNLGKPKVAYSGYAGWREYTHVPEMMSGDEYVQLAREAARAQNNNVYKPDEQVFTDPSELKAVQDHHYYDWLGAISNPALITNHSLQASGGTDAAKYALSGGYYFEDGMVNPQDFTRYTFRSVMDLKLSEHVTFGGSMYLTHTIRNTGNSDLLQDALRMRPTQHPESLVDGSEMWKYASNGLFNPLTTNQNEFNQTKTSNIFVNAYLAVNPVKGLELKSSFSPRLQKDMIGQYRGKWTKANQGTTAGATNNYRKNDYTDFVWDNIANYKWSKGIHNLDITGVFSMQQNVMEGIYGQSQYLTFNSLWYNLQGGSTNSAQSSYTQSSLMSYLARVNYTLLDKYLITASMRYDGSSKLAEGNKWGLFPSAAVAWRLSEESFLMDLRWLSNLKLRLSYGETGNDSVSPYSTDGRISGSQYIVIGGSGVVGNVPNNLRNTKLTWERSAEYNLGLDFGLFDSRISGNIDVYNRLTTNLIMPRSVPATTGYSSVTDNVGSVRNKGIEVTVNTLNVKSGRFTWRTNINLAYNKNEIVDLVFKEDLGAYSEQLEGMVGDFNNKWFIGQPIKINWAYQTLGVWQLGEEAEALKHGLKPGNYRVRDFNDDGVISANKDQFLYGHQTPDWTGGMTNMFNYGNVDFSVNMYFQTGAKIRSQFYVSYALENNNQNFNNMKKDYWTPENPTNASAQPSNMGSYRGSDATHLIFGTDFLKVGYVTLGYTVPKKILSKAGLNQFRFYATMQNPFTFTSFPGFDPGQPNASIGTTDMITRNIIFGLNFLF